MKKFLITVGRGKDTKSIVQEAPSIVVALLFRADPLLDITAIREVEEAKNEG